MRKRRLLLAALLSLIGVAAIVAVLAMPTVSAGLRSTDNFLTWEKDSRIRYEPGAEHLAKAIAADLTDAIATVEKVHGQPFAQPVVVHVCASLDSFVRYSTSPSAGGVVLNRRLFISPKSENTAERVRRILRHELSHLHLAQRLSLFSFTQNIPHWFHEGLAVIVSEGGGAENVTPAEASREILNNRHFTPRPKGSLRRALFSQSQINDGLPPHLFYRQSSLFVAFLRAQNPRGFQQFLVDVLAGHSFEKSITTVYGRDLNALWADFIKSLPAT
jgi:hypothetical protein